MSTLSVGLCVALAIIAVLLTVVVLLQSSRAAGLGAVGGGSGGDSYWNKNKANSMEGALARYTKILGALFMIIAFAINFVR